MTKQSISKLSMWTSVWAAILIGYVAADCLGSDETSGSAEASQWTQAEQKKGYVVFQHSTMRILPGNHVPSRAAIVDKLTIELARGESESVQIGVHNFARPPEPWPRGRHGPNLIDLWVEPSIGMPVRVLYRNMEPYEFVDGNVVGRVGVGETAGFWLTFTAGADTPPGVHTGTLAIAPNNGPETLLQLEVRVRPFVLPRARPAFAAYFTQSDDPHVGYRRRFAEDPAWRGAIYTDMAEHGLTSVDFASRGLRFNADGVLDSAMARNAFFSELDLAVQCGLVDARTPVVCHFAPPTAAAAAATFARQLGALRARKHWPPLLYYGADEPTYPAPQIRERMVRYRGLPFRTVTSMNIVAAYGHGDVHDVWILYGGHITPELKAEAHRLGAEVWTYTHNIGAERTARNRFYAGLYTWAHGAGGNWVWAYYRNLIHNRMVWSHTSGNRLNPMIGYETRREGIDDCRYLQALEDCIAAAPYDTTAIEARVWLDALRARIAPIDPQTVEPDHPLALAEYDAIRREAAAFITALCGGAPIPQRDSHRPWAEPGLKDEAAAFRDKAIEDCIAALRHEDMGVRRSAALALYERGPQAEAAVRSLAALLDDPEVRIPALRALEAIGVGSAPAAPRVAALLSHSDPFVRLAGTMALGAMGPVAIEPLETVRNDSFKPIAHVASRALAKLDADKTEN